MMIYDLYLNVKVWIFLVLLVSQRDTEHAQRNTEFFSVELCDPSVALCVPPGFY
jgi:hypothetical protein